MAEAAGVLSRAAQFLPKVDLQTLLDVLRRRGYEVIGPTIAEGAIVYEPIERVEQLPRGWSDEQGPGMYRLVPGDDNQLFRFNVGPHSWKRYLFPPKLPLGSARRDDRGWTFQDADVSPHKYAFLGVRACELAAIAVQDRVLQQGPYVDPVYAQRRRDALLIAVNCTKAASTCFCTSFDTGPRCTAGFDLALTELADGFVIETGSQLGADVAAALPVSDVSDGQLRAADAARQQAEQQITKQMDTSDLRDLLLGNLEHARWDEVAERCLSCTNCTLVCPTCFCCSVVEVASLAGDGADRVRQWDSCFHPDFSHLTGGAVRNQIRSRYRQWLTHKLASWIDQFDTSGCVGCGRCISWCPVGIDLTEEVAAIRSSQQQ